MSASRIGGRALWKRQPASVVTVSIPRRNKSNKIPTPKKQSTQTILPRRTNPHLVNLKNSTSQSQTRTQTPTPESTNPESAGISPKSITFFGIGVLAISTYTGYLYATYKKEVEEAQSLQVPHDVSDRYNETAPTYDSDVDISEKLMRLGKRRQELVRMARGNVLEVSCGTGRNLEYYVFGERRGVDEKGRGTVLGCRSVTFVDLSEQMVEVARRKFERLLNNDGFGGNGNGNGKRKDVAVTFRAEDARDIFPDSPKNRNNNENKKPRYFDTIIQTMGLCSMPDPVATLRHLGSITEPENGRILLLEHGRSYYEWLNRILDNLAPAHADRHGCWWNRDIGEIVRQSGLEVVEEKRWHWGTTWRYVLRVKRTDTPYMYTKTNL